MSLTNNDKLFCVVLAHQQLPFMFKGSCFFRIRKTYQIVQKVKLLVPIWFYIMNTKTKGAAERGANVNKI